MEAQEGQPTAEVATTPGQLTSRLRKVPEVLEVTTEAMEDTVAQEAREAQEGAPEAPRTLISARRVAVEQMMRKMSHVVMIELAIRRSSSTRSTRKICPSTAVSGRSIVAQEGHQLPHHEVS